MEVGLDERASYGRYELGVLLMTWSKNVTLWCDGDCDEWYQASKPRVSLAESEAAENGWTIEDTDEHYCPDCSSERGGSR